MSVTEVRSIIEQVERLLADAGELPEQAELAFEKLLNVVEALDADKKALADEVERLRKKLDQKKKNKTTDKPDDQQDNSGDNQESVSNHSSKKRRKSKRKPKANDRRSFKDVAIHETIECPVDPETLPPDGVRVDDEIVIVQDIEIKPQNTKFQRHVFYSASQQKYYRGPLLAGYDGGDFGADLRALILSLKYCGNMSEPKIREFLENFDVQVSAGSLSNILTNTARPFEQEYHDLFIAGLSSTPYQQTDDTSARVKGEFWNTHILCNPFYTLYSTRPSKDRLSVLGGIAEHARFAISFWRNNAAVAGRGVLDSPEMVGRNRVFGRSGMRHGGFEIVARWLVRPTEQTSPHGNRTRRGDCILPSAELGACGANVGL